MDVRGRIRVAFEEDAVDSDELRNYLTELRVNWRQAELTLSRTISLILLTCVAFELLTRGVVSEVSVVFLKISNATQLVAPALPVMLAYLTLNLIMLIGDINLYELVHETAIELRHKSLYDNHMEVALEPPGAFFTGSRLKFSRGTSINRALAPIFTFLRIGIYLILPVIFLAYTYVRLLATRGLGDVLVWASMGISAILVVAATLLFIDFFKWSDSWY